MNKTYEQKARDLLEGYGVNNAQQLTACDVVELANILARIDTLEKECRWAAAELSALEDESNRIDQELNTYEAIRR